MNILIIEDDKVTLKTLQFSIENLGHTVSLAENGKEAIDKIVDGNFDLVLCDVMMPGISGLSLVSTLRSFHHYTVPIIIMSALNNKPLLDAALEAGANDFIPKPFSIEDIKGKLLKYGSVKIQQ